MWGTPHWAAPLLVFCLDAVLLLVAAAPAAEPLEGQRLRDWVAGLTVDVPPFELLPEHLGFAARVRNGACRSLQVGGASAARATGGPSGLDIEVHLSDLGFGCTVQAEAEALGVPTPCEVTVVAASSSVTLGLAIAGSDGLPAVVPRPKATCQAQLQLQELSFSGGSLGCRVLRAANRTLRALIDGFASRACDTIVEALDSGLAQAAANASSVLQRYLVPARRLPAPAAPGKAVVDIRSDVWEAPVGAAVRSFLREVGHTDDLPAFNGVLDFLLRDTGLMDSEGLVGLPDGMRSILPTSIEADLPLSRGSLAASVALGPVALSNLTSLTALEVGVQGPQVAFASGTVAPAIVANLTAILRMTRKMATLELFGHAVNFTSRGQLAGIPVSLWGRGQVSGSLAAFAALDREGLASHQLDQMQRLGCSEGLLARGLPTGPLQLLELRAHVVEPTAAAAGGASPGRAGATLPGLGGAALEVQLLDTAVTIAGAAFDAFGEKALLALDGFASGPGRALLNDQLQSYFAEPHTCPPSNFSTGYVEGLEGPMWGLAGGLLSLAAACGALLVLSWLGVAWRRRGSLPSRGGEADAEADVSDMVSCSSRSVISLSGVGEQATTSSSGTQQRVEGTWTGSLASSGPTGGPLLESGEREDRPAALALCVPAALRWGMVLGVLGTIFLFVVATLTPGVTIQVHFASGAGAWATPDVARLSLDNTIAQMMRTRAYCLAAVVVVFSLVWPYLKLLLMLYAWLVPMRARARGPLLVFLDQIGKWSLTDNIVMFLLIVLFWIRWEGTDVTSGGASKGAASFGLKCTPGEELNVFVAATVLSLVLGHSMLATHRWQCGGFHADVVAGEGDLHEPLCRKLTLKGSRPSTPVVVGTTLAIVGSLLLVVVAACVDIVEVRMDGLVGAFQDVTGNQRARRYSLLGVVLHLRTQGSLYLQVVLATFALLIPLLYLTSLLVLWVAPLTPRRQLLVFTLGQTLSAWSSLDVFMVAYLGAALGGEQFGIERFIELVVYEQNVGPFCTGLRDKVGVECLSIRISMLPPAALVAAAAAACAVVGSFVYRRAYLAMHIGKAPSDDTPASSPP